MSLNRLRPALCLLAAMSSAACGSLQTAPPAMPAQAALRDGTATHSWMAPDAKKSDLLYVSDNGTYDVYVYTYPHGKMVGTLTGFDAPKGICVNKAGDVFIVNEEASDILEYAHGGTSPIATLSDPGFLPYGCAVDLKSGNLAVSNAASSYSSQPGSVAIYAGAKGQPSFYGNHLFDQYLFCGYDKSGDLFVDGLSQTNAPEFAELANGSSRLTSITLNQSFELPGGVQWHGKYLAVGDTDAAVIYQFSISGTNGSKVGSTQLDGGSYVLGLWIEYGKVVGADNQGANVRLWKYPAGGGAIKTITGLTYPTAVAVSRAKG